MSRKYTDIIAFLILALVYSLPLYGGMMWSQSYIQRNADKPGMAEIRRIAQENNLKHSEVSNALRQPRKGGLPFIRIFMLQAIFLGFTLGLFAFLRRITSRFSKQEINGAQQGVAPYGAQGAPPVNADVRQEDIWKY